MQQGAINAVLKSTCNSDAALTVFNKLNDESVMAVSANYSADATSMGVAYRPFLKNVEFWAFWVIFKVFCDFFTIFRGFRDFFAKKLIFSQNALS